MYYSSANVRKRTDKKGNPWQGVLRHKDQNGKWHETKKSFASAKSKGEAQVMLNEWRTEMEAAAQAGLHERPETTVIDAVKGYLARQYDLGKLSTGTYQKQVRQVENAIEPYFADQDFYTLTRTQVSEYVHDASLRYCAQSVRNYYSLLGKTYKNAVRNGEIDHNPCDMVELPEIQEHKINYLDQEGRRKFLTAINQLNHNDYRYIAGMIAYYTGMRASEICALQWGDINFAVGRISVSRAASTVKDKHNRNIVQVKRTKTRAGKRTIPLTPQLRQILLDYLDNRDVKPSDGVLEAKRANPSNLCGCFLSWTRSKGIIGVLGKPITLHGLRHTFATIAVQSNADIKSIASMLGHARADMTLNVYASDDEQAKSLAMESISAFWQTEEETDF